MAGFVAAARQYPKLATAIHRLLPPLSSKSPERAAAREKKFRKLLQLANERSPFYRKKFRGIDLATCAISQLPTLNKAEMMSNLDDIFTDRELLRSEIENFMADPANVGSYYKGKYGVCHTSGSQGQPAIIVQDANALLTTFAAQFARGMRVKRRVLPFLKRLIEPARFSIITQKPGFYPSSTFFSYFPPAARPFLKLQRLSVFDPAERLVEELNRFQPNFITAYTNALEVITREHRAGRLKLRNLEQMTNISEPLPEAVARDVEQTFGVHVTNVYSMAECMALTCGCACTHGSHLNDELAILEIVDRNNQPVPPGTAGGKVLLTNLYNTAQPFIRYELDDVVTFAEEPCACGNPLPLIRAVDGRGKDQFWIEVNGQVRNLPYYFFLLALHNETSLAEHQFLQTGLNTFMLRAAPQAGKTLSRERLYNYLASSVAAEGLSGVVKFEIEIVDRILPEASGKVRRAKNVFGEPPSMSEPASRRA